jgi:hypothetical protein
MKYFIYLIFSLVLFADKKDFKPALVDFDSYEKLVAEVKNHRASKLLNLKEFVELSKNENTIILDTRTKEMYFGKHIKGAVHLNFSAFTSSNLKRMIPNKETKILIYCNNNFEDDPVFFATKAVSPVEPDVKNLTLALNIPTYINLFGYGYKNIYELSELISVSDKRVELEGTAVRRKK